MLYVASLSVRSHDDVLNGGLLPSHLFWHNWPDALRAVAPATTSPTSVRSRPVPSSSHWWSPYPARTSPRVPGVAGRGSRPSCCPATARHPSWPSSRSSTSCATWS
ncbi:hypothetical protein NKH77_52005 [Streptomyces sp. M19]